MSKKEITRQLTTTHPPSSLPTRYGYSTLAFTASRHFSSPESISFMLRNESSVWSILSCMQKAASPLQEGRLFRRVHTIILNQYPYRVFQQVLERLQEG